MTKRNIYQTRHPWCVKLRITEQERLRQDENAKYRVEQDQKENHGSCNSCWCAVFRVENKEGRNYPEQQPDGGRETSRSVCCPWRRIFSTQGRQEAHIPNSSSSNANKSGICSCWRRILRISNNDKNNQQANSSTEVHDANRLEIDNERVVEDGEQNEGNNEPVYFEIPDNHQQNLCCPWVRTFWVNEYDNTGRSQAQQNVVQAQDGVVGEKPNKCCGWTRIFWVNRDQPQGNADNQYDMAVL